MSQRSILARNIPKLDLSLSMTLLTYFAILLPVLALLAFEIRKRHLYKSEPRGCRKIGSRIESSLADEYNPEYAEGKPAGKDENGKERWKVKGLFTYPVKSCRGIELYRGDILKTGIHYDRIFTFAQLGSPFPVSASTPKAVAANHQWKFISQRTVPLLALVRTEIWLPDPSSPTYSPRAIETRSGGVLVIKFPWEKEGWRRILARIMRRPMEAEKSFRVPLEPNADLIKQNGYETEPVIVQKSIPMGLNMSVHVPPELKYFLGITHPMALFRVHQDHPREVFRCAPKKDELGYQPVVGFADAYPLHILNLTSVRDVGMHVAKDIPKLSAMRFRPNILITGPKGYAEDHWKKIRIGDYEYYCVCRTTRCILPTADPDTGEKNGEHQPQMHLNKERAIDQGARGLGCLGMQMVPAVEKGTIKVGDDVEVLETGAHWYLRQ
ncbi:MAG: hypothetical protein M1836_006510 [Candelina mexicana]|nr:MAG: hypothetical protein M1836_006510 [Candelina mexicana]